MNMDYTIAMRNVWKWYIKVLYSRYDQMKSTLLISNFSLAQFERDLGTRLWSRLHENGLMIVPCYWDDYRKR